MGELMDTPVVFVEMKPNEAPRERSSDVWWRAIAEDGTRFDAVDGTDPMNGWAVSSSPEWARRDSGLVGGETLVQQNIRKRHSNGFRMVEVSPDCPLTDDLRETYAAALAAYALLLREER